ncbi:MAG: RNA polymerase sigma factor [Clostridia bacterium]|nr:RNA polymerase sigma factor [Clostridia bacterium]
MTTKEKSIPVSREAAHAQDALCDEQIVALYFARDERAIRATQEKYGNYLLTVAYHVTHSHEDAQECLNDALLGAWNSIPPHRPEVLRLFLARIVRNTAIDKYRHTDAEKRISPDMVTSLESLDALLEADPSENETLAYLAFSEILSSYLDSCTERARTVFTYRYLYADSVPFIAQTMGLSERTVFRELTHLKEGLRERLTKEGYIL